MKTTLKKLTWISIGLLIFTMIGCGIGKAQGTGDAFSSINLSDLSDNGVLELSGTNVSSFKSFTDDELTALVVVLDATPTIPVSDLPTNRFGNIIPGTYWSLKQPDMPPLPDNVFGVDVWPMADGSFLLDDIDTFSPMRMGAMADGLPSLPGGGGTNAYTPSYTFTFDPGTNLWIAQWNVATNIATGIASNTIADVSYEMLWATNLLQANWTSLGFIVGSEITNWTALIPQTVITTNNGFLKLRSWLSSDGSGIPDWWEALYGLTNVDPNAQDSAGDGYTLYQKYQLGTNPSTWVTPAAPQGFSVVYNASNNTATLNWLPTPGNATNYTVEKTYSYNYSTTVQDFPASANTYSDNVAGNQPNPLQGVNITVSYTVRANYTGGQSANSAGVPLEAPSFVGNIIGGSQGATVLAVASMPANTTSIRLTEIDETAIDKGDYSDAYATNFTISIASFTNGTSTLPNIETPPSLDSYYWVGQAIGADASLSAQGYLADNFELVSGDATSVRVPIDSMTIPFYDGRVQLKQNLIFQLRSAAMDSPLHFAVPQTNWEANPYDEGVIGAYTGNYRYPSNYVYTAFIQLANPDIYTYGFFDPWLPFEENSMLRNFVFTTADSDENGNLTTGVSYDDPGLDSHYLDSIYLIRPFVYQFQTSWTTYPALLDTNIAASSFYDGTGESDGLYWNGGVTFDYGTGGITMNNNLYNWFGLPLVAATIAYNDAYTGNLATNIVQAGGETILPPYDIYYVSPNDIYAEVAQPKFQTIEYDFWNPTPTWNPSTQSYLPYDSLPGSRAFSPTNASRLFLAGVGTPVQIAGYAKLEVTNSIYTGVYGYLGQYFDQAYTVTNGVATGTNTGILSPYGNFLATQAGQAALVTMPDLDTGLSGTCMVYSVSLALDKNHDGTMDLSFNGPDSTSINSPFTFWCNNNFDRWDNDGVFNTSEQDDVLPGSSNPQNLDPNDPDCNYTVNGYRHIPDTRDLEDFARLWICGITTNLLTLLPTNCTITLSWGDVGSPNPANPTIDLFQAVDVDGGMGYLTNETVATAQLGPYQGNYVGRLAPGQSIQLNANYFGSTWRGNYFIWCGVSNGIGGLTLTIADGNGNTLAQTTSYIQIEDIKQMYERWTVGDRPSVAPLTNAILTTEGLPAGESAFEYAPLTDTSTPYILLAHGYNMKPWEKDRFAETAYKRLYWQGYQGRFGAFNWPTAESPFEFRSSELQAWQSAQGLLNKLNDLNAIYPGKVYLAAHSLGNVVAGEALRLAGDNQVVNTYVAMQGAVSAHAYDPTTTPYTLTEDWGAPDVYAYYWTSSSPCYFNGSAGAGTYVNFYNTNDWALNNAWLLFQNSKPVLDLNYSFVPPAYYFKNSGSTELFFPTNTYELFDEIIQSRSYALGMQPNVGGVFTNVSGYHQVNLQNAWPPDPLNNAYRAHIYHSAEFRSDNPQRWLFWDTVLVQMGLKNSL